jgi:hypothetical protein
LQGGPQREYFVHVTKGHHPPTHQIELRVRQLAGLFNSMDPTPFLNRDLDNDAEEFLETWAMEFPQGTHFRIIIHIEEMPADDPQPLVTEAIHNYFAYKALISKRMLRSLLLEGRTSLLIGLGFLFFCLISADALAAFQENALLRVLKEGLIIGGWVAMWRPMQVFLYEWWPLARRGRIFSNLATAKIHVVPGNGGRTA